MRYIVSAVLLLAAAAGPVGAEGEIRRKVDGVEVFQGLSCKGHVELSAEGKLIACTLAEEAVVHGNRLPESTTVVFEESGEVKFCFLGRDTVLEGHLCRGEGHGYMTGFHPGGKLRLCWLKKHEEIQGVPCRRATFLNDVFGPTVGVYFHDNGKLQSCKLDRDVTVEGRTFRAGERIHLDREGKPAQASGSPSRR